MASFIERYVRIPVASVSSFEKIIGGDSAKRNLVLRDLQAKLEGNELTISLGEHQRCIERYEDQSLASEEEDLDSELP